VTRSTKSGRLSCTSHRIASHRIASHRTDAGPFTRLVLGTRYAAGLLRTARQNSRRTRTGSGVRGRVGSFRGQTRCLGTPTVGSGCRGSPSVDASIPRSGTGGATRRANRPSHPAWRPTPSVALGRHRYNDLLPSWFQVDVGLEDAATLIRTYEVQFIPGLLQTEPYARSSCRSAHRRSTGEYSAA
jgi:Domain of unknown function (DUF5753)